MSEQLTILTIPYESLGANKPASCLNRGFENALNQSIEEVFSTLGPNVKQTLYIVLEVAYELTKENIASNLEAFANALEETFSLGAKLLEIKILEKLHAKTEGFTFQTQGKDLVFTEYLQALQNYQF